MKICYRNLWLGLGLSLSVCAWTYDIADTFKTGTQYQGRYTLNAIGAQSLGLTSRFGADGPKNFFTTTFVAPGTEGPEKTLWSPDLLYKVMPGADDINSLGLRLIPVSFEATAGQPGSEKIDYFLRKLFWGKNIPGAEYYSIVAHTHSGEDYFTDLGDLAGVKSETSIGHSSTNYGNNRASRRGFGYDTNPKNVYVVSLKGVDQIATNTNLLIWAKLYYDNPQGYSFSDDYHRDQVTSINLEEVLAFGAGWLDRNWVRADLNAKVRNVIRDGQISKDFSEGRSFYSLLRNESYFKLYCFEGVNNAMNLGLNIPLTLTYMERIFGKVWGVQMLASADAIYKQIQRDVMEVPASEVLSLVGNPDLPDSHPANALKVTLSKMKPLWEVQMGERAAAITPENPLFLQRNAQGLGLRTGIDGTEVTLAQESDLQNAEIRKVGKYLSMDPESTIDIIRDFVVGYAPFHKIGAVRSTATIMGFKRKLTSRTGISEVIFDAYSLDVLIRMFQYEAGFVAAANPGNVEAALANYEVKVRTGFRNALRSEALLTAERNLLPGESARPIPSSPTSIRAAIYAPVAIDSSAADFKLAAWRKFRADTETVAAVANTVPVQTKLADLENLPRPNPGDVQNWDYWRTNLISQALRGENDVKWNFRPGILGAISQDIVKTNPNVMIRAVTTVLDDVYVEDSGRSRDGDPTRGDTQFAELQEKLAAFTGTQIGTNAPREK